MRADTMKGVVTLLIGIKDMKKAAAYDDFVPNFLFVIFIRDRKSILKEEQKGWE